MYGGEGEGGGFYQKQHHVYDGKRHRKPVNRQTIDFNAPLIRYLTVWLLSLTLEFPFMPFFLFTPLTLRHWLSFFFLNY
jgi:hypothetical protein